MGALGPKQGAPVSFAYTPPSSIPKIIPWLALLVMLLPRFNRTRGILWILVPLLLEWFVSQFGSYFDFLGSDFAIIFAPAMVSNVFATAALWLLLPVLNKKNRFITAFFSFLLTEIFGVFVAVINTDWESNTTTAFFVEFLLISLYAITQSVSFALAGRSCRKTKSPLVFMGWDAIWLLICWAVVSIVFSITSGSPGPLILIPIGAIICFGFLFPYLILALLHPFHQMRLMNSSDDEKNAIPPMTKIVSSGSETP